MPLPQPVMTSELALPSDELRKPARFFDGEEARKIITLAAQPYRTMFAIAGMAGLRVGEVLGLQKADLDFDRHIIHVQRSAWHGQIQTVKSKASRAPVAMAEALTVLLKEYLSTWKANPEGAGGRISAMAETSAGEASIQPWSRLVRPVSDGGKKLWK